MKSDLPPEAGPQRVLTLFDAVCIIVGTIIGAGIFQTAPRIAESAGSFPAMMALWLVGGFLTIVGALCFAELTTNNRQLLGGDYGFLKMAYGRPVAFMFAWTTFWIIRPGNVGAMALTFAIYFDRVVPFESNDWPVWASAAIRQMVYAIAAVIVLSAINLIGLRQGKRVQNILTVVKVLGLLAIVSLAFFVPAAQESNWSADAAAVVPIASTAGGWLLAMVFIMFSFGGWNDLSFIANEIKSPEKNLFRSLICGSVIVTAIYLVVNVAFVTALGFPAMAASDAVATDVVHSILGSEGVIGRKATQIIAGLICISCLGAINGIIITSPRIYHAAGRDFGLIRRLGQWDLKTNQPWLATVTQAAVTIGLFSLCFQYENPFEVIVVVSAPFFWTFLGLAGLSLIVLRKKQRYGSNRHSASVGFRVPLYPAEPIILAIACFAMTWSSVSHVIGKGFWITASVVVGLAIVGAVLGLFLKPNMKP